MNLRNRLKNPQTIMRVGLVFLVLASMWPRYIHLTFNLGEDWIDALRGALYGIAIGCLLWSVRRLSRQRCGGEGRT